MCNKSGGGGLADPRRPAHQRCSGIYVVWHTTPRFERSKFLLPFEHHIIPIAKPLGQLLDSARVANQILKLAWDVPLDPQDLWILQGGWQTLQSLLSLCRSCSREDGRRCGSCCTKQCQQLRLAQKQWALLPLPLDLEVLPVLGRCLNRTSILKMTAKHEEGRVPRDARHHFATGRLDLVFSILPGDAIEKPAEADGGLLQRRQVIDKRRASICATLLTRLLLHLCLCLRLGLCCARPLRRR
mmetsp:Transcript_9555/g.21893  ORF Transcript_9555/g.21893 Transcript_9555/m.21893 type:complete len:242 (+) Transcript_9555:1746-2471(+)